MGGAERGLNRFTALHNIETIGLDFGPGSPGNLHASLDPLGFPEVKVHEETVFDEDLERIRGDIRGAG